MKKSLLMMGMAALALASCTNEEMVNIPTSKAIGFDAFVDNTTKAVTPLDLAGLKGADGGFYVFGGYADVPGVFNNTKVTWKGNSEGTGGAWAYSPLNYWKKGETYKFAAYAPALNVTPTYDYAANQLTFTGVKSDMDNQVDFLAAQLLDPMVVGEDPMSPVAFTFRHAKAMIKIKLVNDFRNGVKVNIANNFKVNGILGTADFVTTTGKAGDWSNFSGAVTYTGDGELLETKDAAYEPEFFIIPQTINDNVVTVTFTVTLTDSEDNPVDIPNPDEGQGTNVKSFTIKIPAITWNQQQRYSYTAHLNGELFELQSITFGDPKVEGWGGYGDTPVEPEK